MRILCFGDSIMYGKVDSEGGWADRIKKHYNQLEAESNYKRDTPNVYNQAISGDTAEDILERFDVETKSRLEDEVAFILAVGTNDSSKEDGVPRYSEEEFEDNLKQIIQKMKRHSSKILIVGLLPVNEELTTPIPWRPNRHYTNEQVQLFNSVIRKVCKNEDLPLVELFQTFEDKLDLFPDGLHPNDEGHKLITTLILPSLEKL